MMMKSNLKVCLVRGSSSTAAKGHLVKSISMLLENGMFLATTYMHFIHQAA